MTRGVLLTGPSGVGKALLAKAVAGEAGVNFLFVTGSVFDEVFTGVGAKRVRELFARARDHSPCIIFIDELPSVGGNRSGGGGSMGSGSNRSIRQTVNQLLPEIDGFHSDKHAIIVIGATN